MGDVTESKLPVELLSRRPTQFVQIANAVGTTGVGLEFPFDNHLTLKLPSQNGMSSTQLKLNTSVTGNDIGFDLVSNVDIGLIVAITADAGSGAAKQWRRITGHVNSTLISAISPAWTVQPAVGDSYIVLLDLTRCNDLHVKTEYSANSNSASIYVVYYDYPQDGSTSNKLLRAPLRYTDILMTPDNQNNSSDITTSGWFHGRSRTVATQGALGAKILLNTLDAGKVSLWAGGN